MKEDIFQERLDQLVKEKSAKELVDSLEWVYQLLELSSLVAKEIFDKTDSETVRWIYKEIVANYNLRLKNTEPEKEPENLKQYLEQSKIYNDFL